jgi:hypothetical protein
MSNMLEQAIIDASSLRDAALKNAESMIVEKYSEEVKSAVGRLLEQDPSDPDPLEPDSESATDIENTAMEQVPMAHEPRDTEEEIVVVDLDDILAAADEEDGDALELDREEIADEVGIDLSIDDEDAPANRSDEIEINEDELVEVFKEMLSLEISPEDVEALVVQSDEEESEDREEAVTRYDYTDGMDKSEVEELRQTSAQNESLRAHNKKMKHILQELKTKLKALNLQNARLLYTNKVLTDTSLNEQQKNKIAEMVSQAKSAEESRTIFETLQKTMAHTKQRKTQSLSEVVSRKSSVILSSRHNDQNTADSSAPTLNRWATLAGLNNTDKK